MTHYKELWLLCFMCSRTEQIQGLSECFTHLCMVLSGSTGSIVTFNFTAEEAVLD